MKEYDFVVIGSGIAGLSFALKAAKHGSVAVITKRKGSDTNTAWAQGGIACVTSDEDSFELHVRDTLEAGAGLCDEAVVRTIVTEGPERIQELSELGLHFDEREVSGHREFDLGKEGGHSKRRVLHVRDATGKEIEQTLLRELGRQSHVQLLENHMAVDLITAAKLGFATEDRCLGVYVLDEKTGEVDTIRSNRIVLASGGCGKVYLYTTNPDIATGDGVAMAWRAGVEIANMEFIQFHPTCLFHSEAKSFLISEAVRGEGGILRNNRGDPGSGSLRQQLQEARWLIKNIQQRFETILRVAQAIVERQKNFFAHGEIAMRPLVLREIADTLGLHESTVSRVTTGKYMLTPFGTLEFKYFFGSHVSTDTGGAASSTAIRALIKQLIGAEDSKSPLSDSRIAELLAEQGFVVARRTVAKYREALKIPAVNLRKSL